ncbi:DegT/DnrJ/EryC1/StrS family aminotransferase [Streptomyces sp. NBC_01233]|uniref:DegT/DnrJ/EryC1/StrS family aminotransferase n=1 Tax=Streptomyces sp. NBC_01233 TaxID=2903787 RepID=UPI002E11883F|nr:DegT/DnrJ/EryC1/StrS family aminotransferase [Streptomyces sp. NBC_01233]
MTWIDHNAPLVTANDRAAVDRVLQSGWIAPGPERHRLEEDLASYFGSGRTVATTSGTLALFLALVGLDAPAGALIAVPTYSCVALLDAVRLAGCRPLVVDVEPDELTMSPEALRDAAERIGQPYAAFVVHTYGATAALPELAKICPNIVEDCCHSFGSEGPYGRHGTFGRVAVSSLYATKVFTGATGGLCWSADPQIAERITAYTQASFRSSRWPRMTLTLSDLHAALARSQLSRLAQVRERRAWITNQYLAACPDALAPTGLPDPGRLVYRFVLRCADEKERERLLDFFHLHEVDASRLTQRHELLHRELGFDSHYFPAAEAAVARTLSLPLYPAMSDADVQRVCDLLTQLPR